MIAQQQHMYDCDEIKFQETKRSCLECNTVPTTYTPCNGICEKQNDNNNRIYLCRKFISEKKTHKPFFCKQWHRDQKKHSSSGIIIHRQSSSVIYTLKDMFIPVSRDVKCNRFLNLKPAYHDPQVSSIVNEYLHPGTSDILLEYLGHPYGIRTIYSTLYAFAAILNNGQVITWGNSNNGGSSTMIQSKLYDVNTIYSTDYAFTARRNDGSTVTWGAHVREYETKKNVQKVWTNSLAFVAKLNNGSFIAWGHTLNGGTLNQQLVGVVDIYANSHAFAAKLKTGRVITWGLPKFGGNINSTEIQKCLIGVKTIYGYGGMFMAQTCHHIVTWGWMDREINEVYDCGSDIKSVVFTNDGWLALLVNGDLLDCKFKECGTLQKMNIGDVANVFSTRSYYAGLLHDGTVKIWTCKGYDEQHIVQFENVQFVYPLKNKVSSPNAFMLELKDNIVKTWWDRGNTYDIKFKSKIKSVINTATSFGILLEDGTAYNCNHYEGFKKKLENVDKLYATYNAYTAVLENGTVNVWGSANYGGSLDL